MRWLTSCDGQRSHTFCRKHRHAQFESSVRCSVLSLKLSLRGRQFRLFTSQAFVTALNCLRPCYGCPCIVCAVCHLEQWHWRLHHWLWEQEFKKYDSRNFRLFEAISMKQNARAMLPCGYCIDYGHSCTWREIVMPRHSLPFHLRGWTISSLNWGFSAGAALACGLPGMNMSSSHHAPVVNLKQCTITNFNPQSSTIAWARAEK